MSKRHIMFFLLLAALAAAFAGSRKAPCDGTPPLVEIPAGSARLGSREPGGLPHHDVRLASFRIGAREVTCGEYAKFRDEEPWKSAPPCMPAAHVSCDDARRYCEWLSAKLSARVRLPTEDEWEYAARAGLRGAPFPWGWDAPAGRSNFNSGTALPSGKFPANSPGLRDCAGNLAEWCETSNGPTAIARGGSFADRDPSRITVFHRAEFPRDYRDADVGFRILVEK